MDPRNEKKNTQEQKQAPEILELDIDQMDKVSGGVQQNPETWMLNEED